MRLSKRTKLLHILLGSSFLLVVFALSACGGSTANGSSVNQPVKQVVTPTATKLKVKTYKGDGYTIDYPQDWKIITAGSQIAFTDSTGYYNLTLGSTPNPNANATSDQLAEGGIKGAQSSLKSTQPISVPATMMVGGQSWSQRALSGTTTYNGATADVEADVLATNYPTKTAKTKGYVIACVALKKQFFQAQNDYFTPMLASFKFAV